MAHRMGKSAGTQAEDALEMKKIYQVFCGN